MTDPQSTMECQRVQQVLDAVGRRWASAILRAGGEGARRFGEYRRMINGISDRVLSLRLKELESLGLIQREVIASTPVQILYRPTLGGLELLAAMTPLFKWSERHIGARQDATQPDAAVSVVLAAEAVAPAPSSGGTTA